jgi:geranylgeranyl diphosphate synthase type II
MYTYQNLIEKCNAAIAAIEYPKSPQGLYEPIAYALSLGGKRIRPVFMLLSAQLFSKDAEAFMDAAVSIEMYHNYTLLHDDLMDNADVRRGKPTVHRRWDANTAILSGDAMLMEVYKRIFTAVTNQKALEVFLNTA